MLFNKFDFGDMYIREVLLPNNKSFWWDIFTSWLCVMKKRRTSIISIIIFKYGSTQIWKLTRKMYLLKHSTVTKRCKDHWNFLSSDRSFMLTNLNLQGVCTMKYNCIISAISKYLKRISVDRSKKGLLPSRPYYFETIVLLTYV